jgi:hypothetical protein
MRLILASVSTTTQGGDNNLLLALHKYASLQDENFTTETFVHLLRHLQAFEPVIVSSLLGFLSGGRLKMDTEDCSKLKITTQNTFMEGRPDILMGSAQHFVIIEVKVDSQPGWNQLDRYRALLETRPEPNKCLILLTRYSVDEAEEKKVDSCVRWHRTARFLLQELKRVHEGTSEYLIRQFLEFLMERGIAMGKVSWELVRGVQSLMVLMGMVVEAVGAAKLKAKSPTAGIEFYGRYFTVDGTECWSGIYYSKPQAIVFETYNINKTKADAIGLGRVQRDSKGTSRWTTELDLEAEEVHFFALSSDSQQSRIQEFIAECVSTVRKIGTAVGAAA